MIFETEDKDKLKYFTDNLLTISVNTFVNEELVKASFNEHYLTNILAWNEDGDSVTLFLYLNGKGYEYNNNNNKIKHFTWRKF